MKVRIGESDNSLVCELCGNKGPMLPYYPQQQIVKCPKCQLVFYGGQYNLEKVYSQDYFSGAEYWDYITDKQIIQRNFDRRIKQLRQLKPMGRLLEIGSAYGFFLERAQKYWKVRGIDIVPEAVAYARQELGLEVMLADFLDLTDELQSYDIICMWDTIEHLEHPVHYIKKAARWLKPGGLLVMTTGDIGSFNARFRKQNWRLIHPPTHLYYFSVDTLSKAVQQAGLKVMSISHVGYSRSYKAMLHGLCVLNGGSLAWLYRLLTLNGQLDFRVYLNLDDIMLLIAVK